MNLHQTFHTSCGRCSSHSKDKLGTNHTSNFGKYLTEHGHLLYKFILAFQHEPMQRKQILWTSDRPVPSQAMIHRGDIVQVAGHNRVLKCYRVIKLPYNRIYIAVVLPLALLLLCSFEFDSSASKARSTADSTKLMLWMTPYFSKFFYVIVYFKRCLWVVDSPAQSYHGR